ncbi:MAG: 1,4-alpha-glucan branching protein GlgB, partial [Polyangiales bacterium]
MTPVPSSMPPQAPPTRTLPNEDFDALVAGRHRDPHRFLGSHVVAIDDRDPHRIGVVVRVCRPDVTAVVVVPDDPNIAPTVASPIRAGLFFEARFYDRNEGFPYRLRLTMIDGREVETRDAYAFWPTLSARDLGLFAQGEHPHLHGSFGAHVREVDGTRGTSFVVWAPQAKCVAVSGDFNHWNARCHPMRCLSGNGVWEIFIPGVDEGALYKFEVVGHDGHVRLKSDPFAFAGELRPRTASIVHRLDRFEWGDAAWIKQRSERSPTRAPLSIYEVHLGGFKREHREKGPGAVVLGNRADAPHTGRFLTYDELADALVDHCTKTGFTHVELMPITEHPYDGSWGYQVTGYFAATARHGNIDGLRRMVDKLHRAGIGVILDWVPAHFPKDAHGLGRFDGTGVYEHLDPRRGEHLDWGTYIFNYGRSEVRNFLVDSAMFWLQEVHFDGLRVDAVASMLYLDYSRGHGQWLPNEHGGRENLDAIAFLRELNERVRTELPGAMVIAEESTSWPGVSRPTYVGGLGFAFKWNMGWMHDTLAYFSMDPIFRSHHHGKITFGLWYAWNEQFVLPISHDEVVHLKKPLILKMPGDRWQRFANLRALYGLMWAHPGKKLLFMGQEIAETREFAEDRSVDWSLLDDPSHAGVMELISRLNATYRREAALWEADGESDSFQWIDASDVAQSVFSFVRKRLKAEAVDATTVATERGGEIVCLVNATPIVRRDYRIGVPRTGRYRILINTDERSLGGGGITPFEGEEKSSEDAQSHGFPASLVLTLPPLSTVWLRAP